MNKKGLMGVAKVASVFTVLLFALSLSAVPVLATHTSLAELQPEWSVPGVTNDYDVEISNTGGDSIDEVRIMQNPLYTGFDCDEKADWTLIFVENFPDSELGIIDMCWYFTDDTHAIPDGESETFYFEATAPEEDPKECLLTWKFETRDIEDFWRFIYDTTSIDSEAPETTKTLGTPKRVNGNVEWINSITPITLDAVDMSEDCGIGVDKTLYLNILAEDYDLGEEPCWNPEACQPGLRW